MEKKTQNKKLSTDEKKVQKSPKSKSRMLFVLAFIILAASILYVICRGNYLETIELGEQYISIFWQNLSYTAIAFAGNFVILYLLIYYTNKRIQKGLKPFFEEEKQIMPKMINKSLAFILAIIVSFITTNMMLEKFMLCIHATSFGMTDPVLGYDIGFFLLQQPFIEFIVFYLLALAIGLTVYGALYYIIAFNFYFDGINRETLKKGIIPKQLCHHVMTVAILLATLIFVKTHNVGIQKFLTLSEVNSYALYGAGATEAIIYLWAYRILSVVIVVSVWFALRYFQKQQTKKTLLSLMAVPAYLIAMLVVVFGYETFWVKPNELDSQKKYIDNNINYTKQAYGINIDEISIEENETITSETLKNNENVVSNIAIVDTDTVLKNLNVAQTNKGYYTYRTTKMANAIIDGMERLVYLSPREIESHNVTYNNKTYEYTHGYGVIVTSATSVDENGNLVDLQKGFGDTTNELLSIKEPRIYFGLETNNTVVTNSDEKKEFDYPITNSSKAENATNAYEGKAGLKINFLDRFILGVKKGNLKLAFSGNVDKNSTILINRNIIERAKTVMPYLLYDENPYMVVTEEGKLVWVLDAYTISNYYPYSQRTVLQKNNLLAKTELNYIRNSVKVLIDAYDGTIQFYITDRNDPIAIAYQKIYQNLFAGKDEQIPEDIQKQLVYPPFLYKIQAGILEKYHNVQPDVLYRGNDIWDIATHSAGKTLTKVGTDMAPYYTLTKTVNSNQTTLGLVLPFTPYQKQNLIAYMVGTYENGEPKLTIYKYSQDSNILGPMQIDTQLEQDERISKEIESLNVPGTRITKNMLIIPIEKSLLYVEPIYQQYINEENSTPILKKVVVASGNKVAIGNTIAEALKNLVSQEAVDIEVENTDNINDLVNAIIKAN
ncbi:MAG: UPF0182 family protein [Clostridia bacterium]|nr:UPF0182 family protein [Clostridia bacterium]